MQNIEYDASGVTGVYVTTVTGMTIKILNIKHHPQIYLPATPW